MNKSLSFIAEQKDTLLNFLLSHIKGMSRNNIKNLLSKKQVLVDGKIVTKFDFPVHSGQNISVAPVKQKTLPSLPFDIIYEDNEIIVIDKPAGLLSIATEKEKLHTAYHIVNDYVKQKNKHGRIFIVHRLDKDTSGVLLFAKTDEAKRLFQDNWEDISKLRRYLAIVEGKPPKESDTIISTLLETETHLVYSGRGGKKAITHYTVLKSSNEFSLLDVKIDTGRKNQIRVHMKDIGTPVTGDKKYGALKNPVKRLCLHACELVLTHPKTKKEMSFKAKTPKDFKKLIKEN